MPCSISLGSNHVDKSTKSHQFAQTASIPCRTRRSRATISITGGLPPWLLKKTTRRRPARTTLSPIEFHCCIKVSAETDNVPAKRLCSSLLPTICIGIVSTEASAGSRSRANANTPALMLLSTDTGRCGPCCSMAASGCSATARAVSSNAKSSVPSSCQ